VRAAGKRFRNVADAEAAGYALFHGCVTRAGGAMGVDFVNREFLADGALDAARPEALLYEQRNGRLRLVGVEYVVLAEGWDAVHAAPPALDGQRFAYNGASNRYGIAPFYALDAWAGQSRPAGAFADWHPQARCTELDLGGEMRAAR
jgi:hypothetical protein